MNTLSVVIPARNAAPTIEDAVQSVLGIDRLDEVVVVDDGSTDGTAAVVSHPSVRVLALSGSGHGPAFARNAGAADTTSPVLLFLDADDCRLGGRTDSRWAGIDAGADVVVGRVLPDRSDGSPSAPFAAFLNGAYFITRAAFEQVGGFRADLGLGEEVELLGRLQDSTLEVSWIDDVVLRYRLGHGSLTARRADRANGLLAGLRATIERRAGQGPGGAGRTR